LSYNHLPILGYYNNKRTTIIKLTNTVPLQLRLYTDIIILLQNIIQNKNHYQVNFYHQTLHNKVFIYSSRLISEK
jgi:hypothetical protein